LRNSKRLPILWKFFLKKKNFKLYLRDIVQIDSKNEIEHLTEVFFEKYKEAKAFHKINPDLRFSQIIQTFVVYKQGFWYYIEDDIMLIKLGLEPREILYWKSFLTKELKKLKKVKVKLIKDLETDHIQAILAGNHTYNLMYLKAFNQELKLRKESKIENISKELSVEALQFTLNKNLISDSSKNIFETELKLRENEQNI
jgi:hypothetical protein